MHPEVVLLLVVACCQTAVAQFNQCSGGDTCINIRDCPKFGPHFNDPGKWSDSLKVDFRKRVCKREHMNGGNVYKVCCGAAIVRKDSRKRGLALLDLEGCGPYTVNKIAFGETATLFQFPWMALLIGGSPTQRATSPFICGGTLINERYVLTAAHCLRNIDIEFVRLGEYDLSKTIDCDRYGELCAPEVQDIAPERITYHEEYNSRKKINDIGLIRLSRKATLNENVIPICLPVTPEMRTEQSSYTVAGWGSTHNAKYSDKLMYATLKIMPNDECSRELSKLEHYAKTVPDSQMCAIGNNRSDNCGGDSGGPLKTINVRGRYVQYGVVSYGLNSCGKLSAPGVYTKVESYIGWIFDHMEE